MKARIFKTGDKVIHSKGGPVMTVEKYATNYRPLMGWDESDFMVICQWRGENRFHREIIHQSDLSEYYNEFFSHQFNMEYEQLRNGMDSQLR